MERSYQFLIKEINDPQMASETSRDKYYTLIDFIKRTNELEAENERLRKIIKIFEIQIIAARRANSLGLCKRALIHAVDNVNKIKLEDK